MTSKAGLPLTRHIPSRLTIWLVSLVTGLSVFGFAILLQWLIYDDWMHDAGPVRVVGSILAGALAWAIAWRWQYSIRDQRVEMLHRFENIRWMNDRIRNSLQAIECITYAADPEATESVRAAVDAIEQVLQEVIAGAGQPRVSRESASQPEPLNQL